MESNPYESPKTGNPNEPNPARDHRMNGRELFGVAVRAIGLYFLLMGMIAAIKCLFQACGFILTDPSNRWLFARAMLEWALPGIIPFFHPNFVVRLAYRDQVEPPAEDS